MKNRVQQEPFNLVATLIFILAILHTFMASKCLAIAHKWEKAHEERIKTGQVEPYEIHLVDVLTIRGGKIAAKRSYRKSRL